MKTIENAFVNILGGALAITVVLGALFLFFSPIIGIAYIADKHSCESRWEQSGKKTDFGLFSGCLVEHDGKLIPEASFRINNEEK